MIHDWGGGWIMGWMWVMGLVGLVATVAVVWLIVYVIARGLRGQARGGQDPEEILKERYARGEIDDKEYQHRLSELRR